MICFFYIGVNLRWNSFKKADKRIFIKIRLIVTRITVFNYKDISIFRYRAILEKLKLILVIKLFQQNFTLIIYITY